MPSPALIQRYKQCQQKIAEVERTLSSGDRNVLISELISDGDVTESAIENNFFRTQRQNRRVLAVLSLLFFVCLFACLFGVFSGQQINL